MRENIKIILNFKDVNEMGMEFMLELISMISGQAMEYLGGIMDNIFKEIGKMESKMVLVFGGLQKEIIMKDNGSKINNKEKDYFDIKQVRIGVNLKIS